MEKIKNIEKAADRIKQAVKNKERIILYGDSDLDGVASAVILEETIKNLGGEVNCVAFPNREIDGYGINQKALQFLKEKAPAVFITLDLGIGNVKEVDIANSLGFEVIIVDHHEPLKSLPKAKIIVNPHQEGGGSEFDYLCNAGLTFKLVEEILGDGFSAKLKDSFLELTALATIADMVPQVKDNKIFIEYGLKSLPETFRPGLAVFFDIFNSAEPAGFFQFLGGIKKINSRGEVLKIISVLNTAESVDFKNKSYELLTGWSVENCKQIAQELIDKLKLKQQKIKEIVAEVERRIADKQDSAVIFEGDPAWKLVLAGPVASIIAAKYEKPTFIFKKADDICVGSVRSLTEGKNSVEAMKSCSDLLITYGGHPKASGFRIKTKNLEKFKKCLAAFFKHET